MKIGIYCRVSSESQSENTSLPKQIENGKKFCNDNDYQYEVFDEIVSGTKKGSDRDKFKKLEDKLYSKELDGIWIYDWDRMIRELGVGVIFRDLIISTNCRLFVGSSEKKIESDEGSLEFGISSVFSDYWRRKISREMDSGKRRKLENDDLYLGVVGIGYEKVEDSKRIRVNENERDLIVDLFKTFLRKDVKNYRDLIKRLITKYGGVLDRRISEKSVSRILRDEKYKGVYNLNWKGKNYPLTIGRIVEDDLFNEVKIKIDYLKGLRRGNTKNIYLLKGLVKCFDCGDNMWMRGGGKREKSYRYYQCRRDKMRSRYKYDNRYSEDDSIEECSCIDKNLISVVKLEYIVWNSLFEVLGNSEEVKNEFYKKYSKNLEKKNEFKGKLEYYDRLIKKQKTYQTNIVEKYIKEEITLDEKNRVSLIVNDELDSLEKKYNDVSLEYERMEKGEEIMDYIDKFKINLQNKSELNRNEDRRRYLEKYVKEVRIKYKGKDNDNHKEYDVYIKFSLEGELEGDNNIDNEVFEYKSDMFSVYTLNHKGVELTDLIYHNNLEVEVVINLSIIPFYIYIHSYKIIEVY